MTVRLRELSAHAPDDISLDDIDNELTGAECEADFSDQALQTALNGMTAQEAQVLLSFIFLTIFS